METSKIVLGHRFVPFDEFDKSGFCGAEPGSLICYTAENVLIWNPKSGIVSEMLEDDGQIDWVPERIN